MVKVHVSPAVQPERPSPLAVDMASLVAPGSTLSSDGEPRIATPIVETVILKRPTMRMLYSTV